MKHNHLTTIALCDYAFGMKLKRGASTPTPDYRLRRMRVIYLALSVVVVLVIGLGIQSSNNAQTCGQTANFQGSEWWKSSDTKFDCSTPNETGSGTSMDVLLVPILVLGVGYLFLPRLCRYLFPPKADKENSIARQSSKIRD